MRTARTHAKAELPSPRPAMRAQSPSPRKRGAHAHLESPSKKQHAAAHQVLIPWQLAEPAGSLSAPAPHAAATVYAGSVCHRRQRSHRILCACSHDSANALNVLQRVLLACVCVCTCAHICMCVGVSVERRSRQVRAGRLIRRRGGPSRPRCTRTCRKWRRAATLVMTLSPALVSTGVCVYLEGARARLCTYACRSGLACGSSASAYV